MRRNLSVRTKLVVMVAVPITVLAIATIPQVVQRSGQDRAAYLVFSGGGIALTLLLVALIARSITMPLAELASRAERLSRDQLPTLMESLLAPGDDDHRYLATTIQPIEIRSHDELGKLATAFNAMQTVAVDVAAEQSRLLRKGISDLFINLARRNQSLVDRQIRLLDQLEADEDDPAVLAELFRLDHLATRMRRNAESLLVLAGIDSTRRRKEPVAMLDAVRAAISEVEDYERVELVTLDDAVLVGSAVVDVAHLIAELIDNATQLSPPNAPVSVSGFRTGGSYQVVVTDLGVGMTDMQLANANALLADPPVVGLALSRSLGLFVAARIAARHGISVRLDRTGEAGITASVLLPRTLLDEAALPSEDRVLPPAVRQPIARREAQERATPEPIEPEPVVAAEDEWPAMEDFLPATLADAIPQGRAFDEGLAALLDEPLEPPLERRTPKLIELDRRGEPVHPIAPPRRSPEEVRDVLARYRAGLESGRVPPESRS